MTAETGTLVVRTDLSSIGKRENPADLRIERINCPEHERRPAPLTPRQLDEGLTKVGALVAGAPLLFAKWVRDFQKHSNAFTDVSIQRYRWPPGAIPTSPTTIAIGRLQRARPS